MSKVKKVGVWLRVSTQQQVTETDSLEHHEIRAKSYCESKGWKVVETYRLEGMTGKNVMDYPQTIAMLADIKSGKIDTLVFSSLSRLARNTKQLLTISELFQKHDASLVSLKEAIDTTTPAGRMFFAVQSSLSAFESEEISERVKASVVTRAKLGKSLGGVAPFGYNWNEGNSQLLLDPQEAPIRKEMFEVFLSCKRVRTTAKILNEKGYRTRRGAKFNFDTLRRLISNPIAKGLRRSNYSYDDGTTRGIKPESEWIYTQAPAIVTEEIYDAAQALLLANARPKTKKARLPVHPFSGVTYCCCEDVKMRVLSSTPEKYTCPKCRAKIPKTDLEEIYKQQLTNLILSPAKLSEYAKSVDASIKEKQKQLHIAKNTLSEVLAKSQKYLDLYVEDKLSKDAFARVNDPLDVQITELEKTVPELEKDISEMKVQVMQDAQRAYDSESLYEKWDSFDDAKKVQLIASLTDKIVVCQNKVEISLYFIPSVINDGNLALNPPPINAVALAE